MTSTQAQKIFRFSNVFAAFWLLLGQNAVLVAAPDEQACAKPGVILTLPARVYGGSYGMAEQGQADQSNADQSSADQSNADQRDNIQSDQKHPPVVTASAGPGGEVEFIDCEPLVLGGNRYLIIWGRSQLQSLETHRDLNGRWETFYIEEGNPDNRVSLDPAGLGLCLAGADQQVPCTLEISEQGESEDGMDQSDLSIWIEDNRGMDSAPIEWYSPPRLQRLF